MSEISAPPSHLGSARFIRPALTALAVLITVGCGVLLGRTLMSSDWIQAVTIAGLGSAGLLLLLSPGLGLLAWILLIPFASPFHLGLDFGSGIPNLDLSRLATLLLGYLLVSQAVLRPVGDDQGRRPLRLGLTEALMAGFTVAMLLSVFANSTGLLGGVQYVFDFVAMPFFVYLFARNWLSGSRGLKGLVGLIALAGLIIGIIATREQLTGLTVFSPVPYSEAYEAHIRKVKSLFGHPANISMSLAVSVPILIYGIQRFRARNVRLMLIAALVATLAGVFFAYMRAGWLGAVLGIVIITAFSPGLRRTMLLLLPVFVVSGLIVSATLLRPGVVEERLTSEAPINYRLEAWQISWAIVQKSPLTGVGFNQFGNVAVRDFAWNPHTEPGDQPSPHNTYLGVMVSGGLLAVVPYIGVLLSLFRRGLSAWRRGIGRDLVGVLWATLIGYAAIIGTFDALNAQYSNLVFFLICGALVGRLDVVEAGA